MAYPFRLILEPNFKTNSNLNPNVNVNPNH